MRPFSIPSNIAEGQARYNQREFAHFLRISLGSLAELETQLVIAERNKLTSTEVFEHLLEQSAEVGRLIAGLRRSVRAMLEGTNGSSIREDESGYFLLIENDDT